MKSRLLSTLIVGAVALTVMGATTPSLAQKTLKLASFVPPIYVLHKPIFLKLADDLKANIRDLTPRECDVLNEVVGGRSTKEIAFELKISPKTVEVHRARVMQKMKARSLAHLIRMALAVGINVGWA